MKIFNRIDEQGRFLGLKFDKQGAGQYDSHTYSYMYCRKLYKEMHGDSPFGLEQLPEQEHYVMDILFNKMQLAVGTHYIFMVNQPDDTNELYLLQLDNVKKEEELATKNYYDYLFSIKPKVKHITHSSIHRTIEQSNIDDLICEEN